MGLEKMCRALAFLLVAVTAMEGYAGDSSDVTLLETNTAPASLNLGFHDVKRVRAILAEVGPGHKVEMECQTVAPDASKPVRHIVRLTPLNKAGKPDGQEQIYVDWYRRATRTTEYRNGERQGIERQYDVDSGATLSETPWDKGVITGVKKTFYSNGKPSNETPYEKGVIAGPSKSYSEEGNLIRVVNYADGKRDGESIDYWPEKPDAVQRIIPYRKGLVEGVAKAFYLSGKIKWERPFTNNQQHGMEKQYAADGVVEKTLYWLKGNPVSEDDYRKHAKD